MLVPICWVSTKSPMNCHPDSEGLGLTPQCLASLQSSGPKLGEPPELTGTNLPWWLMQNFLSWNLETARGVTGKEHFPWQEQWWKLLCQWASFSVLRVPRWAKAQPPFEAEDPASLSCQCDSPVVPGWKIPQLSAGHRFILCKLSLPIIFAVVPQGRNAWSQHHYV